MSKKTLYNALRVALPQPRLNGVHRQTNPTITGLNRKLPILSKKAKISLLIMVDCSIVFKILPPNTTFQMATINLDICAIILIINTYSFYKFFLVDTGKPVALLQLKLRLT